MTPKDFSSQRYLEKHKAWFYVIFAPLSCTIVVPRWQRSKSLVVTSWRSLSTGNLATWLTRVRWDVCILRLCTRLPFPSQWLLLRSSAQMHAPMQWCPQARRRMSTLKIDYGDDFTRYMLYNAEINAMEFHIFSVWDSNKISKKIKGRHMRVQLKW